ncbi:B-cell receptor-associated 31-like protein [Gloeophyllum trabeum ATCC 11539]|uniref:Endoplasmic reticulum transmembrane protein n=1 Tax=Gloeophyllum trabeum (strain ATCC 11539 / FP-39264 / Madison 617) TaxID=670483 RepID=S7Q8M6_GLOTA|nr:B-cell receptor-associated 31-like protein [Gloeophyllum trabeum ATCC 11539]EPQ55882.1 B-cell receptor-associated 31-like protein [Gloeophyllum trabeum ATCC 11539]
MTIYYNLTFLLLAAEMGTFCVLVAPLPYALRRRLFHFLSESPVVAKLAYALKISFIFVGILFVDALQRMFRVTAESDVARQTGQAHDVRTETNFAARKFYSQRNVYLTGFTLFLSLVLTRTFYILLDLIHTQEEYAKLKQSTAASSRTALAGGELDDLKRRLKEAEAKNRDFDTLKSQAESQAKAYDELADRYNAATGENASNKRAD